MLLLTSPMCESLEAFLSTSAEQVMRTKPNAMLTASGAVVFNWTAVLKLGGEGLDEHFEELTHYRQIFNALF